MTSYLTSPNQSELLGTSPINKIVVVGHPLSGFEGVESLLNRCGMQAAAPSQREGLSPSAISATLLKAHRIIPLDTVHISGPIQPLQPGPVWQSLALDLLLGNLDHDLWGWSDPQAVYLLDYWKNLDHQLAFMLVYDTPEDLITRAFDNPKVQCTPETLQTVLGNWQTYNEALLTFYHRTPQRCMLVHAAQVRDSAADYLKQVQTRIGTPLGMSNEATITTALPDTENTLSLYLARHIISTQTQALNLYQELQAVASLPKFSPNKATAQQPDPSEQALEALQTLLAHHQQQKNSDRQIQASQNGLTQTRQENELLLAQLHQVQEELEKHYLQGKDLQQQIQTLKQTQAGTDQAKRNAEANLAQSRAEAEATKAAATAAANAAAAQRSAEQENYKKLTQQLATLAPQTQSKELLQENELLLTQLHQVQEELERYYLENQRLKSKPAAPPKPAQAPAPYGAAERVKQQLSYRLGSKMIARSRSASGWLGMPFALVGVARQYKRELPQRKAANQIPIEKYRDAHEAERVKQHLSYRLGAALIKHGKNPLRWPALPFALQKARQEWLRQKTR